MLWVLLFVLAAVVGGVVGCLLELAAHALKEQSRGSGANSGSPPQ